MRKSWILCTLLGALILGLLPPAYAALFGGAHQFEAISDAQYGKAMGVVEFLMIPGRVLLSFTPYSGALRASHFPFWEGLIATTTASTFGWLGIFWISISAARRLGRLRRKG